MQHISVVCPSCASQYQVEPTLLGKRMRCPNPDCRQVFEVRESPAAAQPAAGPEPEPAAPPPAPESWASGSVGEVVPILHAEAITATPARRRSRPRSTPSGEPVAPPLQEMPWQQPPPRRRGAETPATDDETEVPEAAEADTALPDQAQSPPERSATPTVPIDVGLPGPQELEPAALPSPAGLEDRPAETWEPPPVRRGADTPLEAAPLALSHEDLHLPAGSSLARRALIGLIVAVPVILLAAAGYGVYFWMQSEERQYRQALKDYQDGRFESATERFGELSKEFPDSSRREEYRLLGELSRLRAQASQPGQRDVLVLLDKAQQFRETHKDNPLLKERRRDLGQMVVKLLDDFSKAIQQRPTDDALDSLAQAEQKLDQIRQQDAEAIAEKEHDQLREEFARARKAVFRERERRELFARLEKLAADPSADNVRAALELVRQEGRRQPGFATDERVLDVLRKLREGRFHQVRYVEAAEPGDVPRPREETEPSLFVDPLVRGNPRPASARDPVVLALVRGVLYGLAQSNGEVRWARRLGIDTSTLPLRLPPTPATPEMFLVLSADTRTLTAVRAENGGLLWRRTFDAPCLGRPLVVDQRDQRYVYLPTYDGQVHELTLADGRLLGRFHLGQQLTVGGAHQPGTSLLFFPADDLGVYVLDVAKKRCEALLYLDHRSGSLRTEPVVVGQPAAADAAADAADPPAYLVLSQTDGLDAMRLRLFHLPLRKAGAPAGGESEVVVVARAGPDEADGVTTLRRRVEAEATMNGWPWFQPYHDGEKLVSVTDAGVLGLFGIRQPRNDDRPLFPLIQVDNRPRGTVDLNDWLTAVPGAAGLRGRAQVVQGQESDFWVLAGGGLLRLQLTPPLRTGPRVVPVWSGPLALGSPLHAGQADESGATLFVVTRSTAGQTCLATAVDAEDGRVRWQRQLGLVCRHEPLGLRHGILAPDRAGGLFFFDLQHWPGGARTAALPVEAPEGLQQFFFPDSARTARLPSEALALLAGSSPVGFPANLPWSGLALCGEQAWARPTSAYQVACPVNGTELVVRRYQGDPDHADPGLQERTVDLKGALAGTPGLGPRALVLPRADGSLVRLLTDDGQGNLPRTLTPEIGPPWRPAARGGAHLPGHVVWLGGDHFVTTDGGRALTCWHWPLKEPSPVLAAGKDARAPTLELPARIVAAPVRVAGPEEAVCVADAEGTVWLLQGAHLKPVRQWKLRGKITAGPYVQGSRIACVVDRRRLVWLGPARDRDPQWHFDAAGEAIVGQPQVVQGLVIVADESGRFVGLDPESGKELGQGYTLRASVAPAASPVSFGLGRAFAPLTDGTVLLLSLGKLID